MAQFISFRFHACSLYVYMLNVVHAIAAINLRMVGKLKCFLCVLVISFVAAWLHYTLIVFSRDDITSNVYIDDSKTMDGLSPSNETSTPREFASHIRSKASPGVS